MSMWNVENSEKCLTDMLPTGIRFLNLHKKVEAGPKPIDIQVMVKFYF